MDETVPTVEALQARIEQLTAGADPTPVPEAVQMTAGQLLHRLNTATGEKRLEMAARILAAMGEAAMCFQMDHSGHIECLQQQLQADRALAQWLIAEARWIACYPEEFLAQRKAGVR